MRFHDCDASRSIDRFRRLRLGVTSVVAAAASLAWGVAQGPVHNSSSLTRPSSDAVQEAFPTNASPAHPFTNSLGMRFVAIPGMPVLFSVWETRVKDFAEFVRETGYQATEGVFSLTTNRWKQVGDSWKSPGFPQTEDHPACGVSWEDARAFCEWLSKKEGRRYRLPTDAEWSLAVGLPPESGATPKDKSAVIRDVYPWGTEFPPKIKGVAAGNYPGAEAAETNWPAVFRVIEDYRDPYVRTSPVGMFPANKFGLYDLGGNVWEWCEDKYDPTRDRVVVRGASWVDNLPELQLSSYRYSAGPKVRNVSVGFRCVLTPQDP